MIGPDEEVVVTLRVNGAEMQAETAPRVLLSDFLRHRLGLTGTHVGCEHGICGACTVLVDGEPVRSCLLFAVQFDGAEVTTVEGLVDPAGELPPLHQAFHDCHAMQCGYCTPGFLVSLHALSEREGEPTDDEMIDTLSGNLCRCTGYASIIEAARRARERS